MKKIQLEKATLISDAHFGEFYTIENKFEYFQEFTKNLDTDALVILGDFFDFWYEYKQVIPKRHYKLLRTMETLISKGTKVYYLAGNHDFSLGNFLEEEIGLQTFGKESQFALQSGDRKILCVHGDEANAKLKYQFVKKMLKNDVCNKFFSWIHPDIGIYLADQISSKNRYLHESKSFPQEFPDDYDFRLVSFANDNLKNGFDGVIAGHYHLPRLLRSSNGFYLNLGDWRKKFTFGEIINGEPKLFKWNGSMKIQIDGYSLQNPEIFK
ncbi:MAG: UDP-2,3-diacylglucosamine diphosphatase [Calditrichaeota bacterium]|nr:MAG: UDP-2,3-diacylglucosamine diphosphatase [Calditrichota bacterium]